ncbi:MAG TPA: class I SAM-dependent methyltransferase [Candidatus Norongarragalinales archaeon]|nr:class I SAM-dependent methyltransferase [Candidatus Norongarragalinales archaeon]
MREVRADELYPDETESARQTAYKEAANQSIKSAVDFFKTRSKPVVWFVGPGLPGEELIDFLHKIKGHFEQEEGSEIHVVDLNENVIERLRRRIRDENLPMPTWHNQRIEDALLPQADLVLAHQMLIFMNAANQRSVAQKMIGALKSGGRLHYTNHERDVQTPVLDWIRGADLVRQEKVRVVVTTEPFHKAVLTLKLIDRFGTRNPKVTYQVRANWR